jgi:hypothetical protein
MRIFHGQAHCQSKQYANYEELQVVELADDSCNQYISPMLLGHAFIRRVLGYTAFECNKYILKGIGRSWR